MLVRSLPAGESLSLDVADMAGVGEVETRFGWSLLLNITNIVRNIHVDPNETLI